jgi:hypothetical protein
VIKTKRKAAESHSGIENIKKSLVFFPQRESLQSFFAGFFVYYDHSKNGKNAKEAPRFLSKLAVAEAAKLKKFSDRGPQRTLRSLGWGAGRTKSGGCPTPADSHF